MNLCFTGHQSILYERIMSDFFVYKLDEFKKDLKKLRKRFPTIDEDLEDRDRIKKHYKKI